MGGYELHKQNLKNAKNQAKKRDLLTKLKKLQSELGHFEKIKVDNKIALIEQNLKIFKSLDNEVDTYEWHCKDYRQKSKSIAKKVLKLRLLEENLTSSAKKLKNIFDASVAELTL